MKARFIEKLLKNGEPRFFKRVNDEDVETSVSDSNALSRAFVFATVEDNPALLLNDPDYLKRLDMLPEIDKRALLYGDWDIFAGQFFKEWTKRIHVIDSMTAYLGQPNNRFIALDYGYSKPASVGWYACFPHGRIVRYKELYIEGQTYEDLAYKILEINGKDEIAYLVADPAIWGDVRHHLQNEFKWAPGEVKGESGASTMQKIFGDKFMIIRADHSRVIGWGRVRECLKPFLDQDGELTANFLVTSNCTNLIRTIQD